MPLALVNLKFCAFLTTHRIYNDLCTRPVHIIMLYYYKLSLYMISDAICEPFVREFPRAKNREDREEQRVGMRNRVAHFSPYQITTMRTKFLEMEGMKKYYCI